MSQEYDEYLHEHIANVRKGLEWMIDHNVIPAFAKVDYGDGCPFPFKVGILDCTSYHDESKRNEEEYDAYDDYFYGKEGKDEEDIAVIDNAFDYAWLHHIHNNPHHWQYWVLMNDDDGTKALEMPEHFIYEMIADWWSFSWRNNDLKEIFKWYENHKDKMILHEKTRKTVEEILQKMRDILGPDDEVDSGGKITEVKDEPAS